VLYFCWLIETTLFIILQSGSSVTLHLDGSEATIGDIKKMVEVTETSQHTLVYKGQKLEENKSLQDYNISDFSELELLQNGEPVCVT